MSLRDGDSGTGHRLQRLRLGLVPTVSFDDAQASLGQGLDGHVAPSHGPPGRDQQTLGKFFDRLGDARCAAITLFSADAAEWIANVVAARCQNAELCLDPFHIIQWATKALDEVRREVWNAARRQGQKAVAKDLKGARYALWKSAGD